MSIYASTVTCRCTVPYFLSSSYTHSFPPVIKSVLSYIIIHLVIISTNVSFLLSVIATRCLTQRDK